MRYGGGYGGLTMHKDVLAVGAGVVGGGLQVAITMSGDSLGTFGAQWVPALGTNGQIINLGTGLVSTALGVLGVAGKTFMGRHEEASSFLLGYGLTALIGGWLVPVVVSQLVGGARRARRAGAAFGPGYPPPPTPSGIPYNQAPQSTQDNIGIVSALSS
ncbi:MAG: hypothetical protein ACREB9_01225 [Thermoplasmata archaeon]